MAEINLGKVVGSDANVTEENVLNALGFTPADVNDTGKTEDLVTISKTDLVSAINETFNGLTTHKAEIATDAHGVTPVCRAYHANSQSIANATNITLSLNSELFDTHNMHDNSVNNSRIVCKVPGIYLITGQTTLEGSTTGFKQLAIRLNSTSTIALTRQDLNPSMINLSVIYKLQENDYVELQVYQNSGASITANTNESALSIVKVG